MHWHSIPNHFEKNDISRSVLICKEVRTLDDLPGHWKFCSLLFPVGYRDQISNSLTIFYLEWHIIVWMYWPLSSFLSWMCCCKAINCWKRVFRTWVHLDHSCRHQFCKQNGSMVYEGWNLLMESVIKPLSLWDVLIHSTHTLSVKWGMMQVPKG